MSAILEPAWEVREEDLEPIAIGAAILGTGGGGNPYLGTLRAREVLRRGGRLLVVDPDALPDEALLVAAGAMGSPVVSHEKPPQGDEEAEAARALEEHLGRRFDAIAPLEMGGGNSLSALVAGATLGVPVLDGDGMGRAFPELSMVTYLIYGGSASPAALADEHGNRVVVSRARDAADLERLARSIAVEMGAHAGIAMAVMDGAHARASCVPHTLTFARRLGEAVVGARRDGIDPVDAVLATTAGRRLFRGKVVDVERRLTGGFSRGTIHLEGLEEDAGATLFVEFQNENLVARRAGVVLAIVPDLITLVEAETAEPITTELVRFGHRVQVLVLPPPPRLTTAEALRWVGPRAFGYDLDWPPA